MAGDCHYARLLLELLWNQFYFHPFILDVLVPQSTRWGHHTEDSSRKTHIPGVSRSLSRVTDAHDNESVLQKFWLTPDLSGPFVSGFQVHGGKQFYNCVRSKLLCRLRWPCFLKSVKYSLVFWIVWSMGQSLSVVRYISAATLPLGSWQPGFDEVTWSEPCSQPSCVRTALLLMLLMHMYTVQKQAAAHIVNKVKIICTAPYIKPKYSLWQKKGQCTVRILNGL